MLAIGGENLIDLVSSSFNPEGLPIYTANPGGSPYNVAIAASKQGGNVSYLTPLSKDTLGVLLSSKLKENGVKTLKWEVTRYLKVSFALTNFIVVLCGIPLVVFREKNSLSFGIGMSVFVIFGYYAFIKFGQSMGFKGQLAPMLSAWLGNIVFFIGGIILLIKARK